MAFDFLSQFASSFIAGRALSKRADSFESIRRVVCEYSVKKRVKTEEKTIKTNGTTTYT